MPPTTNVADKPEVMTGDELSAIEPPKSQNNRIWLSKVMMPIPYGYVVSAMSTVCFAFSSPGQSSTIGIFTDDMIVDLGLSRTELSSLFAAATLCSAALLALPFVGRSLDRFGPSIFSLVVTVLLAAACAAMAEVSGSAALFGCFLAVRFLGQGCEMLVGQYCINQWWVALRGSANGVTGAIRASLILGGVPVMMRALHDSHSWREIYRGWAEQGYFFSFTDAPELADGKRRGLRLI